MIFFIPLQCRGICGLNSLLHIYKEKEDANEDMQQHGGCHVEIEDMNQGFDLPLQPTGLCPSCSIKKIDLY